jgi:hypothetical protein
MNENDDEKYLEFLVRLNNLYYSRFTLNLNDVIQSSVISIEKCRSEWNDKKNEKGR